MRNLTSVSSTNNKLIQADVSLSILAVDAGSTFLFPKKTIFSPPELSWDLDMGGGLSAPGNYKVGLTIPLDEFKLMEPRLWGGTARLRWDVNSDAIYPHVGRVVGITPMGDDPNAYVLSVVDKTKFEAPLIPGVALANSYDTIHPADAEMGYPWYYGDEQKRPFYFTAVDSDISQLIGPRNVSSASHVNSVWWNSDPGAGRDLNDKSIITEWKKSRWKNQFIGTPKLPADITLKHNLMLNKEWAQQSGGNNLLAGGYPFEVKDISANNKILFEYGRITEVSCNGYSQVDSQAVFNRTSEGKFYATPLRQYLTFATGSGQLEHLLEVGINPGPNRTQLLNYTHIDYNIEIVGVNSPSLSIFGLYVNSNGVVLGDRIGVGVGSISNIGSFDISSLTNVFPLDGMQGLLSFFHLQNSSTVNTVGYFARSEIALSAQVKADAYQSFSIFTPEASGARTAISENPFAILDHVNSWDSGIPFVALQSSAAQAARSTYKYHCFFAERRPWDEIANEFGRLAATAMWMGDSGMLNFRAYQQSATAAINATITPNDWADTSTTFERQSLFQRSGLANEAKIGYGYDFQRGRYEKEVRAWTGNEPLCNSAQAAGIRRKIQLDTEYIMDTATASLALSNLVRFNTQPATLFSGRLGPHYGSRVELADVLKIIDPRIPGSESLFQVISVKPRTVDGTAQVVCQELL